ncbi:hypothetical protein [Halobacillus litoralis]|uniref:Uncharacterized protein n=1 Tax=Halobacillus litoralis TaxID=45668 RepID=A0A410MAS1_9BACI|nr:hypothetical protein [Halobacillus litoralis]QAS51831.1 hypothetical protein HLI_06070 [Halobacillus litoralis]
MKFNPKEWQEKNFKSENHSSVQESREDRHKKLARAEIEAWRKKKEQEKIYAKEIGIAEKIRKEAEKIEREKREHEELMNTDAVKALYILDTDKNVIDKVERRADLVEWLKGKGFKWGIGRTVLYHYIKDKALYKNQYYFIPVLEYENFLS